MRLHGGEGVVVSTYRLPRYTMSLADLNLDPKGRRQFFDGRGFLLVHSRAAEVEETALLAASETFCATETDH